MKSKLLVLLFLSANSLLAGSSVFIGFRAGYVPPRPPAVVYVAAPPRPVATYVPLRPAPGYTWVAGYWYPAGPSWVWHAGSWVRPPYVNAYWAPPRYYGGSFYFGYWHP
jgi:hypothetical protein